MIKTLTLIGIFSLLTTIGTAQGRNMPDAGSVTITLQYKDNKTAAPKLRYSQAAS